MGAPGTGAKGMIVPVLPQCSVQRLCAALVREVRQLRVLGELRKSHEVRQKPLRVSVKTVARLLACKPYRDPAAEVAVLPADGLGGLGVIAPAGNRHQFPTLLRVELESRGGKGHAERTSAPCFRLLGDKPLVPPTTTKRP